MAEEGSHENGETEAPKMDVARKICDNCGGRGHIAKYCPSPQTCNCCGSTEHKKADCPNTAKACDVCGKIGHLRVKCQALSKGKGKGYSSWGYESTNQYAGGKGVANAGGGYEAGAGYQGGASYAPAGGSKRVPVPASCSRCFCCGSSTHEKRDCPAKLKACDVCGRIGHLRAMCDMAADTGGGQAYGTGGGQAYRGAGVQCYCCGKMGHEKRDCMMKSKACDLCGKIGHLKAMCDPSRRGAVE